MIKHLLATVASLATALFLSAQITTTPAIIQKDYEGEVIITYDPSQGNGGMAGASQCYAHTGLITEKSSGPSDWRYATPTWRGGDPKYKMTRRGSLWELRIPNIRSFYGCPKNEEILQLAFVFNDGPNGRLEGKDSKGGDLFVDLADNGLAVRFASPEGVKLADIGTAVIFEAVASDEADLALIIAGDTVARATGTAISHSHTFATAGPYSVVITATDGETTAQAAMNICAAGPPKSATAPSGLREGISLSPSDTTRVWLKLYAADNKMRMAKNIFVLGDFNAWEFDTCYQMMREPGTGFFWIELSVPKKGTYAFQYAVQRYDGSVVQIADPYAELFLDPDNDQFIPDRTYSGIPPYPAEGDGLVSVFQTDNRAGRYSWSPEGEAFVRPNKNDLIIYELWVYDFSPLRNIQGVKKRLDYLQNLGVNAIELMPVNEFDGNYSWGYNPNHYFALDKMYGTKRDLKEFVDECHRRGIAVIVDMVFNHATALNSMYRLFDINDNPYFNKTAPHGDQFFEDWNHGFDGTRRHFTRVLNHWLEEYHIDGFRMDLSHGLCGKSCGDNLDNLRHYFAEGVKAADSTAYFILEHWNYGDRPTLVREGMLCWENSSNAYCQSAMGYQTDDSFASCNLDGYVSYTCSHDEERPFYKASVYGDGAISRDDTVRLSRVAANMAMNLLLNGPHMIWQFEELGYDYSIEENGRTGAKPMPEYLGWLSNPLRMKQYQRTAQITRLRTELKRDIFAGNPASADITVGQPLKHITWGGVDDRIFAIANFSSSERLTYSLPDVAGTWHDYFSGEERGGAGATIGIDPGEVVILTSDRVPLPEIPSSYPFHDSFVGTEIVEAAPQITVCPTITDGPLFIESESPILKADVFGIGGQLVMRQTNASSLNIGHLPRGLYLVVVNSGDRQQAFKIYRK